jgi:hypothetical protein
VSPDADALAPSLAQPPADEGSAPQASDVEALVRMVKEIFQARLVVPATHRVAGRGGAG